MNATTKDQFYKQARKQGMWAAVWLSLAILAMVTRPDAEGARQWMSEQALLISGLLMIFQFGRMSQCLAQMRTAKRPQPVPVWASLEAETKQAEEEGSTRPSEHHYQARDIRAFASLEEAVSHGWEFSEPVAHFEGEDVPKTARFNGKSYTFDGLSPDQMRGSVPPSHRLFGRLSYKVVELEPTAPPPSPPGGLIAS